jgi:pimeloyl-ACP methyl ester carboxylesterase
MPGMVKGMAIFPAFGALYPESWDTMVVDMEYYKDVLPLDQIQVPTHMIHGECDADIKYENAERAIKEIPGAILITPPLGTHSCQFHSNWPRDFG